MGFSKKQGMGEGQGLQKPCLPRWDLLELLHLAPPGTVLSRALAALPWPCTDTLIPLLSITQGPFFMIASSLRSRAWRTWRTTSFHLDFDVVIVHSYSCVSSGKQDPQRREPIPWAFSTKTESDQVWCSTTVLSFEPEVTKNKKIRFQIQWERR